MTPRGKPTLIPPAVRAQMLDRFDAGWSLAKIAAQLNEDGVPTPRGAPDWYAQSVRQVIVAERRRRAEGLTGASTSVEVMKMSIEARGVDGEFVADLARTVRLMALGAGAEVQIHLSGADADAGAVDAIDPPKILGASDQP